LPLADAIEAEPSVRERFYRPELDALRFFAFFCVFLAHGLPSKYPYSVLALSGGFGLCLFFLLSSYLITELLLRERTRTGTVHLRAFYARRILRIWPLYFAMLAFGYFFGIVRPDAAWGTGRLFAYLFLLGNFYTARHGQIMNPAGALWSISVEEQFYLLWPSVAKRGIRSLLLVSSLVIPISYFWMYVLYRAGTSLEQGIWTNSLVQFQFFGIGGLLALAFRSGSPTLNPALRIFMLLAGVGLWLVAGGPLHLFGSREELQSEVKDIGVVIEQFGFIGSPRPPESVVAAINAAQQAKYIAQQKQNELLQSQADAAKQVAAAEGQAKSQIAIAQGEAESNRLRAASISPQIIEWQKLAVTDRWIARWNGSMPQVEAGGQLPGMLLNVSPQK
jgi:hypothetical protein